MYIFSNFLKVGMWLVSCKVYAKHLQEVVICYLLLICFILIFYRVFSFIVICLF